MKVSCTPRLSSALSDLRQEVDLGRNYTQTLLLLHLYLHGTPTLLCSRNAVGLRPVTERDCGTHLYPTSSEVWYHQTRTTFPMLSIILPHQVKRREFLKLTNMKFFKWKTTEKLRI